MDDLEKFELNQRIEFLESKNRELKSRIDQLESMSIFSWLSWMFVGTYTAWRKPSSRFKPD